METCSDLYFFWFAEFLDITTSCTAAIEILPRKILNKFLELTFLNDYILRDNEFYLTRGIRSASAFLEE